MRKSENNTVLKGELSPIPNTEKIRSTVDALIQRRYAAKNKNNETSEALKKARLELRTAAASLENANNEKEYSDTLARVEKAKKTIDFLTVKLGKETVETMPKEDFEVCFEAISDEQQKIENEAKAKIFEAAEILENAYNDYLDKFGYMKDTVDLLEEAAALDHFRPDARGLFNAIDHADTIYNYLFEAVRIEREKKNWREVWSCMFRK